MMKKSSRETVSEKKRYTVPNMSVVVFDPADVITASGEVGARWNANWNDVFDKTFMDD